jgi:plastocyanin
MNTHRGRRGFIGMAIALTAIVPGARAQAAGATVSETGSQFVDQQVTITVGEKVVWRFADNQSVRHSVTFDDNTFDQPANCSALVPISCQGPGDTVERLFQSVGRFFYHCKIHGAPQRGMFGIVIVEPASTGTPGSTGGATSSTVKASSTTTTAKAATSSTTSTTRALATSSTVIKSTTTTSDPSSVLLPGEAPPFSGNDSNSAAGKSGGSKGGSDSSTVALIVGLLLAVSAGGGYLLWRIRPGRT